MADQDDVSRLFQKLSPDREVRWEPLPTTPVAAESQWPRPKPSEAVGQEQGLNAGAKHGGWDGTHACTGVAMLDLGVTANGGPPAAAEPVVVAPTGAGAMVL